MFEVIIEYDGCPMQVILSGVTEDTAKCFIRENWKRYCKDSKTALSIVDATGRAISYVL